MQIFLIRETKGNAVHATDTKKRTGCGINLQKPENMARFSVSGTVDDAFGLMSEVTCEKCQTVFTKRVLKADRKEMNRMLKEEKKRTKLQGEDPNLVSLAEVQQERQKQALREARSAARAAKREEEEAAERAAAAEREAAARAEAEKLAAQQAEAAKNTPLEVPSVPEIADEAPVSGFPQYTPPPKKAQPAPQASPTHTSYGGFALDADLAQFAVPKTSVDPTAAAFAANEGKNPNILAQQQESAKPAVLDDPNDIMAQFAVPQTPAQPAPAPAASDMDDLMAQFGIPQTPAQPAPTPATTAASDMDDLMAQFGIPQTPAQPAPTPAVTDMDDLMAQFAVPQPAPPPPAPTVSEMDDLMAQFAVPQPSAQPAPAPVVPEVADAPDMDDLMAQFAVPQPSAQPTPAPVVPEVADAPDMDDLMAQFGIQQDAPAAEPAEPEVIETVAAPVPETPLADSIMEFDMIADRMFGGAAEPAASAAPAFTGMTSPVDEFNNAVAQMSAASYAEPTLAEPTVPETVIPEFVEPEVSGTPTFAETDITIPAEELIPAEPVIEEIAPEQIIVPEIPAQPVFTAPEVPEVPEVPAQPVFTAPEVPEVPEFPTQPEAPAMPQQAMAVPPQFAQPQQGMPVPNMPQQGMPVPNMQQPVAQFMGYDAQGQPVYAYVQQPVMPQFMGYDAQGQPVYAPVAPQFAQPAPNMAMPQQPVQAAPVQPAPVQAAPPVQEAPVPQKKRPLISPMTAENAVEEKLSLPADTERPAVEPMTFAKPKKSQGVRVSKIQQKEDMPDIVRSAISKSAAPQGNIFDQQNADIAVTDSIEDLLSMMGEDTSKYKKKEAADVNLEFKEYKPKAKKAAAPKPASDAPKPEAPARPLTKEELKRQKREEKINAKFKKDLAKRGF